MFVQLDSAVMEMEIVLKLAQLLFQIHAQLDKLVMEQEIAFQNQYL